MTMATSSIVNELQSRKNGRRFLVVDDQPTMRRILDNVLQQMGYAPSIGAVNGNEALQKLASTPVDAIITDWQMPGMNGLDFIKALRAMPETSHLPILVVTAMASVGDVKQAIDNGATSYLLKPFRLEKLREKLEALSEFMDVKAAPTEPVSATTEGETPTPAG